MVVYNLTNLSGGMGNFTGLLTTTNDASNGLMVGLFVLAVFFVMLVSFQGRFGILSALAGSGFACFILSLPLVYLDLLNIVVALAFLFLSAGSGLILYLGSGSSG